MNILQHGCFGTRNYGDERSAWMVRQMVRRFHPEAEFAILGSDPRCLARHHGDVMAAAHYSDQAACAALIRWADLWIHGPGTMLANKAMPHTLDLVRSGKPYIVWGVGAWGEIEPGTEGSELIERAYKIGVRDEFAFSVAAGCGRSDVAFVGDPLWNERPPSTGDKIAAICVSWQLAKEPAAVQVRTLNLLAEFLDFSDRPWVGVPAAWDPAGATTWDNDLCLVHQLATKVPMRIYVPTDFEDLTLFLGRCATLVTSRLHPGVVAASVGANVSWFGQPKLRPFAVLLDAPHKYAGNYAEMTLESLMRSLAPAPNSAIAQAKACAYDSAAVLAVWIEEILAGARGG